MPKDSLPMTNPRENAIQFLGVPIHHITYPDIHDFVRDVIVCRQKATVVYINIHGMNLAWRYAWLRSFFNRASLVYCDGDGIRWGTKILGYPVPVKIPLTRWFWDFAGFCEKQRYRLFFLGGKPGIGEAATKALEEKYPELQIMGSHHGYFQKDGSENEKVTQEINRLAPDILVVGFGMPDQEKWIEENQEKLNAHIFLTAGAMLDCVSRRTAQVPEWMIRFHLEWLFRIYKEPRRLFWRYAVDIPCFFLAVFLEFGKQWITLRRFRKGPQESSSKKS